MNSNVLGTNISQAEVTHSLMSKHSQLHSFTRYARIVTISHIKPIITITTTIAIVITALNN